MLHLGHSVSYAYANTSFQQQIQAQCKVCPFYTDYKLMSVVWKIINKCVRIN